MKLETAKLELFQMILAETDKSVIKDLLAVFKQKKVLKLTFGTNSLKKSSNS